MNNPKKRKKNREKITHKIIQQNVLCEHNQQYDPSTQTLR